ncbi:HD-GYP domain-containing protein [Paenibacillus psychroresistens]|nr:HD-GYP domain-containing protein [Paenibacillus psychroresistens]
MDKVNAQLSEQLVGKRLIENVYNKNGLLIMKSQTILNRIHVQNFLAHRIDTAELNIETIGPFGKPSSLQLSQEMDEAVAVVRDVFNEVLNSKKLPLTEIRKSVIPLILKTVEQENVFEVFAALQEKDDYLYRHSIAVGTISALIGRQLGYNEIDLLQLTMAAVLHDIGKLYIAPELLSKPDKLTTAEFEIMKRHTILGYELVKKTIGTSSRQALVVLQHHERVDGTGYPLGLIGDQIDHFSRIVAVADVFHAMTSRREYRNPFPFYEVLMQMEQNAFGILDPTIIRILINKIMQTMIGFEVILTDGRQGTIVLINPYDGTHPLIHIDDNFEDLSKNNSLQIQQILL